MGSFVWDNPRYGQCYNNRPLSVALTESCGSDIFPRVESDFALMCHPQNFLSGRRFRREFFNVYHPNAYYGSCCCLPSMQWGPMCHCTSRDGFVRNLGSVTVEEHEFQPVVRCVRPVSPIIRELKVRRRPSSCVDLRNQETKEVDIRREERYEYHYNYDLPKRPQTPPRRVRPVTRDTGTATINVPKRPLTMTETERFDRYEQEEKIKKDKITTEKTQVTHTVVEEPIRRYYEYYDTCDQQYQQACRKAQRKDFIQRMNAQNGKTQSFNTLNTFSDCGTNYVTLQSAPKSCETDYYTLQSVPKSCGTDYVTYQSVPKSCGTNYVIHQSVPKSCETFVTTTGSNSSQGFTCDRTAPFTVEESSITRNYVNTT
ncbi:unnamed protein product [Rotaria sordida]|uniref:Uncharacterized protein n=1 Tax=Rotaria sordida TaxID=392033 RepID=A0A814HIC2_9BILA|nr:unnamed protein product [Rotaria sordida]CAF1011407.1 unnamed protein product [Rotaria sordida]